MQCLGKKKKPQRNRDWIIHRINTYSPGHRVKKESSDGKSYKLFELA